MTAAPARGEQPAPTLAEHFVQLARERATGELEITWQRTSRTFGLIDGALVSVESSVRSEQLAPQLAANGSLDAAQIERAERFVRERGGTLRSALMSLRLLAPRSLFEAIRAQIDDCAAASVTLPDATARFDPSSAPPSATRPFACDLLPLVHRGLLRNAELDPLYRQLAAATGRYPQPGAALTKLVQRVVGDRARADRLLSRIDGRRALEGIIQDLAHDAALVVALWVADRHGALRYELEPRPAAGRTPLDGGDIEVIVPEAPAANPAALDPAPAQPTHHPPAAEAAALRKEILALHERLDELDPYEWLRVGRSADAAEIRRAYLGAAKRLHPDKLARHGLSELRAATTEVFGAIAGAYELLSDPEARQRYDAAPAEAAGPGADWDAGRVARAEAQFRKAQLLARAGDFRGALPLAEQSVELWPEEAAYHALLGWTRFRKTPPDPSGACDALRTALECAPDDAQAHWWLSCVLHASGEPAEAEHHAARARQLDPAIG